MNGCADSAIRPARRSKPTAPASSRASSSWPEAGQRRRGSSNGGRSAAAATSGARRSRSSAKTGSRSAARAPGLELVEQRVVGLAVPAERRGLLALQLDQRLEDGREGGEVVARAGLVPDVDRARAGGAEGPHELLGQAGRALAVAPRLAHHRGPVIVELGRRELADEVVHLRPHELAVVEGGQGGELVGAALGAGRGHGGLAVPAQERRGPAQVADGRHPIGEAGPGCGPPGDRELGHRRRLPVRQPPVSSTRSAIGDCGVATSGRGRAGR